MALKKSELYSSLWASCDELRGGMDASQYKDYVLVFLFVKYVSDRYADEPYAPISIPKGASFADMVTLKCKPDIGDQINKRILGPLFLANHLSDPPDFADPAKLGSGKEMVERITNLIAIFENPALDFSSNRADGDDLLGDAYEYLMRHFATESGKSKGQFYTPAEVSRIIAQIVGIRYAKITNDTTVYDPTCGSGSLLLKIGDEARHGHQDVKVTLYGQEKDNATAGLARMNMILHDYAIAEIKQGNTLASPLFLDGEVLKTFDYVVANPPFSDKRWSTGLDAEYDPWQRFQHYGIPPAKQGDYAYLLHVLRSSRVPAKARASSRTACCFVVVRRCHPPQPCAAWLPQRHHRPSAEPLLRNGGPGVHRRGRQGRRERPQGHLYDRCLQGLHQGRQQEPPPRAGHPQDRGHFQPTSRATALLSSRACRGNQRSEERLQPQSAALHRQHRAGGSARHRWPLRGGIPDPDIDALDRYWKVIPGVRTELFKKADRPGYSQLKLPIAEVKPAIFGHEEFTNFINGVTKLFGKWRRASTPLLKGFAQEGCPKALIEATAEDLLATFRDAPLLDAYDAYQHLMDYWAETMQDDCYLIADDGWHDAAQPHLIVEDKNKKAKAKPDFALGKKKYQAELIPPALIIRRWFADEQAAIDSAEVGTADEEPRCAVGGSLPAWGIDWRLPGSPRRPLGQGRAEPVAGGDLAADGRMAGGLRRLAEARPLGAAIRKLMAFKLVNAAAKKAPDGFEIGCDNGERVRVAFALDCCDREAVSFLATMGGISGDDVREMVVAYSSVIGQRQLGVVLSPVKNPLLARA